MVVTMATTSNYAPALETRSNAIEPPVTSH